MSDAVSDVLFALLLALGGLGLLAVLVVGGIALVTHWLEEDD